jgi:hypothetical protein
MAMDNQEQLPSDLLFEQDGHVTEVVLACLADGELALIPDAAAAHVDACDTCTARLGAAALRSLDAGQALHEVGVMTAMTAMAVKAARPIPLSRLEGLPPQPAAEASTSQRARRPPPYAAIGAALLVAIVAGAPGLFDAAAALPGLLRSVPVLARVVVGLLRSAPEGLLNAALLLRWASAVVLIVAGWVVARTMSQKQSLQGEMG